jgi:hypothetical protein
VGSNSLLLPSQWHAHSEGQVGSNPDIGPKHTLTGICFILCRKLGFDPLCIRYVSDGDFLVISGTGKAGFWPHRLRQLALYESIVLLIRF